MRRLAIPALAALAGCVHPPAPATPPVTAGHCVAGAGDRFVGQRLTPAVEAQARRATGATDVRIAHPGEMRTMDYRADRLTITVGAAGRIVALACG